MTTINKHEKPFVVVVGTDYSELSEEALDYALDTARRHGRAQVHVVHVIGSGATAPHAGTVMEPDVAVESEQVRAHVEQLLRKHAERFPGSAKAPFEQLTTHVRLYRAAEAIAQLAADVEADLVVVGTHGRRGVGRFLLGSVAEETVRLAPCPVLVVRPKGAVSAVPVPKIEPPCPRCVEARRATQGKEFWCAQHAEHHDRPHTYRFDSTRSSHQSGLLFPF